MTRQRDNRSYPSAKQIREQRAGMAALSRRDCEHCNGVGRVYGKSCGPCDGTGLEPMPADQQSIIDAAGPAIAPKARGRNVQHESAEQQVLTVRARAAWWGPGYRHHEQATWGKDEARRKWRQGVSTGWPDVTVLIPPQIHDCSGGEMEIRYVRLLALELKRADRAPKRFIEPEWWLSWEPDVDPLAVDPTRHGLRFSQASELQLLDACGFKTYVAYGAEDAFKWLDAQAGPRPEVLPW